MSEGFPRDRIELKGVQVSTHIGVPDEERVLAQTLELDLTLIPRLSFRSAGDRLDQTIDYSRVWERVREIGAERSRKLIETLAEEICAALLEEFDLETVGLMVQKAILPGTQSVAVSIWRQRTPGS